MGEKVEDIFDLLNECGIVEDKVFVKRIAIDFEQTKHKFQEHERILFKNVTFKGSFTLINFKIEHLNSIEFHNCTFFDSVFFRNVSVEFMYFEISNCTFCQDAPFHFWNSTLSILKFSKNKFDNCSLHSIRTNELTINNCSVNKLLSMRDIDCEYAEIAHYKDYLCNRIIIDSPKLKEILIESKDSIESLLISEIQTAYISGEYNEITIAAKDFTHIEISNLAQEGIPGKPAKIGEIRFQETNFQGLLTLEDLDIENLSFQGLNMTNGSVRFNEITIKDTSIYDCTISNFYWNQVKFVNPPEIMRSDVSELKMSNVSWQEGKRLKNSFFDEHIPLFYWLRKKRLKKSEIDFKGVEISDLKYQIETYRQLKAASYANHNPIEGMEFYRNEMKLYWKLIRIEGGISWYDRLLVFMNRWSSDFGQNWFLPLLWLFLFHFIFFSCIWEFNYFDNHLSGSEEFGQYLFTLNPVHKSPSYIASGWGNVTEFFMRVFNAYFIYHFIKATRKFARY